MFSLSSGFFSLWSFSWKSGVGDHESAERLLSRVGFDVMSSLTFQWYQSCFSICTSMLGNAVGKHQGLTNSGTLHESRPELDLAVVGIFYLQFVHSFRSSLFHVKLVCIKEEKCGGLFSNICFCSVTVLWGTSSIRAAPCFQWLFFLFFLLYLEFHLVIPLL